MATFAEREREATGLRWSRPRLGRWGERAAKYAVLVLFLIVFLLPFVWIWASALRSSDAIELNPFGLPRHPLWGNLANAWTVGHFGRYIGNSVIYCATIVTGVVVLSCLAGYAFALLPVPGGRVLFVVFLLGLMVPFQSIMIPLYYLLRDLHLLDTYGGFIVPGIALGLPFGIFLMRAFFRGLPQEIADAARVDGASEGRVFAGVMLPLAAPGLVTLVVFQFMFTWNAFLMPLIFVQRDELRPVSLGLMFFFGRFTSDRGMIAAGVTLTMLPVIVLYLVLQRQFIRGVTAGAVKA